DDPKSFQAYYDANKDKAGGGGGDIGSIAGGLSPEAQEEMKEALKKFSDKYKVSGVGLEGGGGGGGRWPGSGGKDDIADMLKNAFGNKDGDRAPAGAGLTTLFNGQAVGAASDDIFRMITSRYQVKRQEKTFLIDTATSRKPSSKRRY